MDPFEMLEDEHRLIERALTALLHYASRVDDGADPADLASFVMFFAEFADARHHAKEEKHLFEAMVRGGFPRRVGPIGTMMKEHEEGRALVTKLRDLSMRSPWSGADRTRIGETARAFVQLLRAHIQKEDAVLYPMARHNLTEETAKDVVRGFQELEGSPQARGERMAYRALVDSLAARYASPVARTEKPAAVLMN